MFRFFRKHFFLQSLASWFVTKVSPLVEHNLSKYWAVKKAFYLTALEKLEGDYFEFGIFTGGSLICAVRANRRFQFLGKTATKFYGFDSFAGFGQIVDHDQHPFYSSIDSTFKSLDAKKVISYILRKTRGAEVGVIPGYFESTLKGKTAIGLGAKKARVVFIDCDLKDPALLALDFVRPILQVGTIVIMDDFFSYRGDPARGIAGAFNEFSGRYPEIQWRKLYDYGYGGVAYILSNMTRGQSDGPSF